MLLHYYFSFWMKLFLRRAVGAFLCTDTCLFFFIFFYHPKKSCMAFLLVILSVWGLRREVLTPGPQGCPILFSDTLKVSRGLNRLATLGPPVYTVLSRVTYHPGLPQILLGLTLKILRPKKPLGPGQARTVGHPVCHQLSLV